MGAKTLLEDDIDRFGTLITTAQVFSENFDEGCTNKSISVASEFMLEINRQQEAQICPQQDIREILCSRAQFEILRDLLEKIVNS
jgi:hypothetical protein